MREKRTATPQNAASSLTIGQLASATGVRAETIRFYEREGVIPKPSRTGAGRYRLYSANDAGRLRFVRRARELGFGLEEVRGLLTLAAGDPTQSCAEVNLVAKEHLIHVDEKLAQLTALRRELTRLIRACDKDVAIANCTLLNALSAP